VIPRGLPEADAPEGLAVSPKGDLALVASVDGSNKFGSWFYHKNGVVTVLRTSTVADVGQAINPQLVARQDEGATLQGLGNAMFEEMVFAPDGMLMNDTLLGYRIPAFRDIPATMTCSIVENGDGPGPFGAKGCGEGALAAVPAAIVNALADAGVPMNELPLTPERVWRRIRELKIS